MRITVNISQDEANKLLAVLQSMQTNQTAEEVATQLLEDSIDMAYIRHVDGYQS